MRRAVLIVLPAILVFPHVAHASIFDVLNQVGQLVTGGAFEKSPPDEHVWLYLHRTYGNHLGTYSFGKHQPPQGVSSLKVGKGARVRVCRSAADKNSCTELGQGWHEYVGDAFNDRITHIEVLKAK